MAQALAVERAASGQAHAVSGVQAVFGEVLPGRGTAMLAQSKEQADFQVGAAFFGDGGRAAVFVDRVAGQAEDVVTSPRRLCNLRLEAMAAAVEQEEQSALRAGETTAMQQGAEQEADA